MNDHDDQKSLVGPVTFASKLGFFDLTVITPALFTVTLKGRYSH